MGVDNMGVDNKLGKNAHVNIFESKEKRSDQPLPPSSLIKIFPGHINDAFCTHAEREWSLSIE